MNRTDNWNTNPEQELDNLLTELRADEPSADVVKAARSRGWARLQQTISTSPIESCAGFQALFPEYRHGTLSAGRRMLVEDPLHECVACRRSFERSRPENSRVVEF